MMAAHDKAETQEGNVWTVDSPEELYDLLGRAGEPESFSAGAVIFQEGDKGDGMYVLQSGTVEIKDGERVVETVEPPGLFGEMALIESEPRSLTAVAGADAEVVEISARQFWVLVHETPRFAHLVMSVMAHRLRRAGGTT